MWCAQNDVDIHHLSQEATSGIYSLCFREEHRNPDFFSCYHTEACTSQLFHLQLLIWGTAIHSSVWSSHLLKLSVHANVFSPQCCKICPLFVKWVLFKETRNHWLDSSFHFSRSMPFSWCKWDGKAVEVFPGEYLLCRGVSWRRYSWWSSFMLLFPSLPYHSPKAVRGLVGRGREHKARV